MHIAGNLIPGLKVVLLREPVCLVMPRVFMNVGTIVVAVHLFLLAYVILPL